MALAKRVRSFTTVDMERLAEETANVPRIKCTIFCHCEGINCEGINNDGL